MNQQVMQRVIQDGRFDARKVPLQHERILFFRGLGLVDGGFWPQIMLRILAPSFEQIGRHGVELGRIRGHDDILEQQGVDLRRQEAFGISGAHRLIRKQVGVIFPTDPFL